MCPKKRFASKWFGYEYKVKLLFSWQLFYTRSISTSKWRLTPSFVWKQRQRNVQSKTDSATPSIINILARTKDEQISIIVRPTNLYNLYAMWSQIKHVQFFLFVQTASAIPPPREKRTWSERFRLILRSSLNLWIGW